MNMNDTVRVKLNGKGLQILREHHEALRGRVPSLAAWQPPPQDGDGYTHFQLWQLMRAFGPHIYLGCEVPFDLDIRLQSDPEHM